MALGDRKDDCEPDYQLYLRAVCEDNNESLGRLRRRLRGAILSELTSQQRADVVSYYGRGRNMSVIAKERGVNKSTVSRSLGRARRRLGRVLKYAAPEMLSED